MKILCPITEIQEQAEGQRGRRTAKRFQLAIAFDNYNWILAKLVFDKKKCIQELGQTFCPNFKTLLPAIARTTGLDVKPLVSKISEKLTSRLKTETPNGEISGDSIEELGAALDRFFQCNFCSVKNEPQVKRLLSS